MFKYNKRRSKIKYHIDKVDYNRVAKKVIITGWAYSECYQSNVGIIVDETIASNLVIKRLNRSDVNKYSQLNIDETGFIIEFNLLNIMSVIYQ